MYQKLFVFGALLLATSSMAQTQQEPVAVGEKVPDFVVQDLRGRPRKLSELQKESPSGLVSLTFWCSFCHSCRHVEARLDQLAKSMRGKAVVVAVDASAGETSERVSAFLKQKGLSVPVLMDGSGAAADLFGVRVTTTTVVIDGKGVLRYRGRFAEDQQPHAENALQAVLAGKNVPKAQTTLQG